MRKLGFYIDTYSCSGCKTCQISCQDKNNLEPEHILRKVIEIEGGNWTKENDAWTEKPFSYFISISCNHCDDPLCVKACPTEAMHITDMGTVSVDQQKCMACGYCIWACPYNAPSMNNSIGKMSKCDFCYDKISVGEKPTCVAACPMRALDFGYMDDLEEKYGKVKNIYPLPEASLTKPSLIIKAHTASAKATEENSVISNKEEL